MTTYNNATGRHDAPLDPELPNRLGLLEALGLSELRPMQELDELATRFAKDASALTGGQELTGIVNIITRVQFFAGLSTPRAARGHSTGQAGAPDTQRTMSRTEGWCVFTLDRRKAFPLNNVLDYPRSAGNGAMHKLGVKTYLGAPMIHQPTGIILGATCVIGRQETQWDREAVDLSKNYAQEAVALLVEHAPRKRTLI
ncbi:GAF domain-containing protein [Streptomyces alfalfae]